MTALALGIVWVTVAFGVLAVGWTWVLNGPDVQAFSRREANRTRIVAPR